jgi:hypothetical protein
VENEEKREDICKEGDRGHTSVVTNRFTVVHNNNVCNCCIAQSFIELRTVGTNCEWREGNLEPEPLMDVT